MKENYYYHLPVYKDSYLLLLDLFQKTSNLTREYKYTIGEDVKSRIVNIMVLIYKIARTKNRLEKLKTIELAKDEVEIIRIKCRLLRDLGQMSVKKYSSLSEKVVLVSKQITAWGNSI